MNYNERYQPISSSALRKMMVLLDFREALENQRFEECPGLVARAKVLGAKQVEIRKVIAGYVRGGTKAGRDGAVCSGRKGGSRF